MANTAASKTNLLPPSSYYLFWIHAKEGHPEKHKEKGHSSPYLVPSVHLSMRFLFPFFFHFPQAQVNSNPAPASIASTSFFRISSLLR